MAYAIVLTKRFTRSYQRLATHERSLVEDSLQQLRGYLQTGHAPVGLGVKRLWRKTYECRAGLALRIVYVIEGTTAYLALLGRHDDVQRFLRNQ